MDRRIGPRLALVALVTVSTAGFGWEDIKGEWRCASLSASFTISSTGHDGNPWDINDDGAPDPYGMLGVFRSKKLDVSESIGLRTDTFEFTAPFFRRSGVTLKRNDGIGIRLFDKDVKRDDLIDDAKLVVKGRTMSGSSVSGYFDVTVTCEE